MIYPTLCERCGDTTEIDKPMRAVLPKCGECGGPLRRVFTESPAVLYTSAGFYATDHKRLESQIGRERYAQFEKERDDTLRRAKAGRLTNYERGIERAFGENTKQALSRTR